MEIGTGNRAYSWYICVLVLFITHSTSLGANETKTIDVPVDTKTSAGIGFGHLTEDQVFDLKVNLNVTDPTKLNSSEVFDQGGRILFAPAKQSTPSGAATHAYEAAGIRPNYRHAAMFKGTFLKQPAPAGNLGGKPKTDFTTSLSDLDLDVDSDNNGSKFTQRPPDGSDSEDMVEYVGAGAAPNTAMGLRAANNEVIKVNLKLNNKKKGALSVAAPGVTFYATAACAQATQWSIDEAVKPSGQTTLMKVTADKTITAIFTPAGTKNQGIGSDTTGRTEDKTKILLQTGAVTFSPNPIVTGFTKPVADSNIKKFVTATVTPAADAKVVNFRLKTGTQNRIKQPITVSFRNATSGQVRFAVSGISATPVTTPYGDTTIEAYKGTPPNETVLGEVQVIVVTPTRIGRPHPEPDGVVVGKNVALDQYSSPSKTEIPDGKVLLVTMYAQWLDVPVWDQFGNMLASVYGEPGNTAPVPERITTEWTKINQNMKTDGTYLDPVSRYHPRAANPIVTKNSPAHLAWISITDPMRPLDKHESSFNLGIMVGGHELIGGTGNRTIVTTPPSTVKIIWP